MLDNNLLIECYRDYKFIKGIHLESYRYYLGDTDAKKNYKIITDRTNNYCSCNFIKKFVNEEVSYSLGNKINYISRSNNLDAIRTIEDNLFIWNSSHDINAMTKLLIHGQVFEIYYLDSNMNFKSKLVDPRNGYMYRDENDEPVFFLYIYEKQFDDTNATYIDVYTKDCIYHYNDSFMEISEPTKHFFGCVPVGEARFENGIYDTVFKTIKELQDSYETNLSDISNEISDFRNAYLTLTGVELTEEQAKSMKSNGIIQIPNEDGEVKWLTKTINDGFIQNTLNNLQNLMYMQTSHINHNEAMQSNTSSLAIRSRLISLEQRIALNQLCFENLLKIRIKCLFAYLNVTNSSELDYKDIKFKFTKNVPQDDISMAQIISQLGDKMSLETALSLFSFIDNPSLEIEKINREQAQLLMGAKLLEGE